MRPWQLRRPYGDYDDPDDRVDYYDHGYDDHYGYDDYDNHHDCV